MSNNYPPVRFAFSLSIAGSNSEVDATFSEVSGLTSEVDVAPLREGGENRFVHRLPRAHQNSTLSCRRGIMVSSSGLYSWCEETLHGDLSQRIQPKTLTNCWPTKWDLSPFTATEHEVAVETLEFGYAMIERTIIEPNPGQG